MTLFWLIFIVPIGILLIISLSNILFAPNLQTKFSLDGTPKVSVLIPARNEEANIGRCLESIIRQDYPAYEILVLDDDSTDRTAEIIQNYAFEQANIHFLPGEPLPKGWTGKNWACHQLSTAATGDIFVFTDADNWHETNAVSNSVSWLQQYNLGMLSAFPEQTMRSLGERMIIPVIELLVYAGLPLWLTYYTTSPSLAAANGQWMVFTKEAYRKIGGHMTVASEIAEDTALARRAKQIGEKTLTVPGTGMIYGHMYHSFEEVWNGFTKNLFSLMGNKSVPFILTLSFLVSIAVGPYLLLFIPGMAMIGLVGVGMNIIIRATIALRFRHPLVESVIFHPICMILTILIGVNSYIKTKTSAISWKGRALDYQIPRMKMTTGD